MALYASVRRGVDALVHAFFREVEVSGLQHVPAQGGGILVSWHPNGLIDPALIITQFPRRVVFGARDGLFRWPLLGFLMRSVGTVPIHRAADSAAADPAARRAANLRSLEGLATAIAGGDFAALFPEGMSHDQPRLAELKTGAARLYYQARNLTPAGAPTPVIVPVGLFYDRKHRFRSRALVSFHPPLVLPSELAADAGQDDDTLRERARQLTALIDAVLHETVGATEDWPTHKVLHRVRKLLAAERARDAAALPHTSLREEAREFAQVRTAYNASRATEGARIAALRQAIERYDATLRALGLDDGDLDRDRPLATRGLLWLLLLQGVLVFLLLPPVLVVGFVVNAPVALLIRGIALIAARLRKDSATIKLLAGAVLYPLAWALAGIGAFALHLALDEQFALPDVPVVAGIAVALMAMAGGVLALIYLELARETARAIRVRLTRRQRTRTVARLRAERSRLSTELRALAAANS